jgi:hypothetical protein
MLVPATALEVNGAEPSAESPTAIPARRSARNAEQGDLESFPDELMRVAPQVTQGPLRESAWTLFEVSTGTIPAGLFRHGG